MRDSSRTLLLLCIILCAALLAAHPASARQALGVSGGSAPGVILDAGPDGSYALPRDGGGSVPLEIARRGSALAPTRLVYEPGTRTLQLALGLEGDRAVSGWAVVVEVLSPAGERLGASRWIEDRSYDAADPELEPGQVHRIALPVSLPSAGAGEVGRVVVEIATTVYADNAFAGDSVLARRILGQRRAVVEERARWVARLEAALGADASDEDATAALVALRRDLGSAPENVPPAVLAARATLRRNLTAAAADPAAVRDLVRDLDRRLERDVRFVPRSLPAAEGAELAAKTEHGADDPSGDPDLSCDCGGRIGATVSRSTTADCEIDHEYDVKEVWTFQCYNDQNQTILSPAPGTLVGNGGCVENILCIDDTYCPPYFTEPVVTEESGSRWWSRTVTHRSVAVGPCTARCSDGSLSALEVSCNCDPMPAPRCLVDGCPVLIETGAGGFQLTGLDGGVMFDLDADGAPNRVAWTAPGGDDAWLVLDRNGNGVIDDATELFGDKAPQPHSHTPNGFLALAVFDAPEEGGDGDGLLSAGDEVFDRLRLWLDRDHDGFSDGDELLPLSAAGIVAIDLTYFRSVRQDENGNNFRYSAPVHLEGGGRRLAVDVFLDYER